MTRKYDMTKRGESVIEWGIGTVDKSRYRTKAKKGRVEN